MNKFKWLYEIKDLPKMVKAALSFVGLKEIRGVKDNPVIMNMAREIKAPPEYNNDDISWCAVFISYIIKISGEVFTV